MIKLPTTSSQKGQPLHFLLIFLGLWVSMRIIVAASTGSTIHTSPIIDLGPMQLASNSTDQGNQLISPNLDATNISELDIAAPAFKKMQPLKTPAIVADSYVTLENQEPIFRTSGVTASGSHHLLLLSHALSRRNRFLGNQLPKPAIFQRNYLPRRNFSQKKQSIDRWSLSAWAYARTGEVPAALATGGQYGGGQAGAILSYRINKNRRSSLYIYGRLTAALAQTGEEEIAVGARWQPSTSLPVSLSVEQRFRANHKSKTAAFVAGGFGPANLAAGFKLESYGQAGIVGIRNRTPFFDGAVTIEKEVARLGKSTLALGAGAWTGGQDNVARLDIGPRATFRLPLPNLASDNASAKLSLDWRQRVLGNATPDSGPAVTLSTQF